VGEPGINDPLTKLFATGFTFSLLLILQEFDILDPSNHDHVYANTTVANYSDLSLPLKRVCQTQARAQYGYAIFFMLVAFCLGFVIFGTSAQSLRGLRAMCGCGGDGAGTPAGQPSPHIETPPRLTIHRQSSRAQSRRNNSPVDTLGHAMPMAPLDTQVDRIKGQLALFGLFGLVIVTFTLFFVLVPLYAAPGTRDDVAWRKACDDNDGAALAAFGLS